LKIYKIIIIITKKKYEKNKNLEIQRKISACPKTAKVRKNAEKGDFKAPLGAFWRNGKKHSVFQLFFIFFLFLLKE
jgi:hypothetical protein